MFTAQFDKHGKLRTRTRVARARGCRTAVAMALRAVARWEWVAQEDGQLSVSPGDCLTLVDEDSGGEWWLVRRADGEAGFVPSAWLAVADESAAADEGGITAALPAADPDV